MKVPAVLCALETQKATLIWERRIPLVSAILEVYVLFIRPGNTKGTVSEIIWLGKRETENTGGREGSLAQTLRGSLCCSPVTSSLITWEHKPVMLQTAHKSVTFSTLRWGQQWDNAGASSGEEIAEQGCGCCFFSLSRSLNPPWHSHSAEMWWWPAVYNSCWFSLNNLSTGQP